MRRGNIIILVRANASNNNGPLVPANWTCSYEDNYWFSVFPLGRENNPNLFFHARLMVIDTGFTPPRACYVCTGTPAMLQYIADRIAADGLAWTKTWANLQELRNDDGVVATAIKNAWRDDRPFDADGNRIGTLFQLYPRIAGFDDDDGEA